MTPPPNVRTRHAQRGFTLLEVLVALAIVAIAIFPMLQITAEAEKAAFDAKFTALAASATRWIISRDMVNAKPGTSEEGSLSDLALDDGIIESLNFDNIYYEWELEPVDLAEGVIPTSEDEEEEEELEPLDDEGDGTDDGIDDRFRARYARVTIYYQWDDGTERELVTETFLPPLPREDDFDSDRIVDGVGPNN